MSPITTHVLDLETGLPAQGLEIVLEERDVEGDWIEIGRGKTDADGRLKTLLPDSHALGAGIYRLFFEVRPYFERRGKESFYPRIPVVFEVRDLQRHYHVPLLLSSFGYSTYRGS
ncbi:MAG: hydroxyisourate hydrolase [Cyanobacteria bacterium REEB65]|nr:hydroxyisourate hydrolase [Cyanobacteria bacterium REEB65]